MFEAIADFFKSGTHGIGTKSAVLVGVIFSVWLIDEYTSYTFYYVSEKKIEQLENINKIVNNPKIDSGTKQSLILLRREIIGHQNIFGSTKSFIAGLINSIISEKSEEKQQKTREPVIGRTLTGHVLSSSIGFILIALVFIVYLLFFDQDKEDYTKRINAFLGVTVFTAIAGVTMSFLLALIPELDNTPRLNYIINSILSLIFSFGPIGYILWNHNKKNLKQ